MDKRQGRQGDKCRGGEAIFIILKLIYLNNGSGLFTQQPNPALPQFADSGAIIGDIDNDGDPDIVIIGSQAGGLPNIFNIVYENLGNNQFAPVDTIGGEYIAASIVNDFNGDGLLDIIIQGFVDKTNVYWSTNQASDTEDAGPESLLAEVYPNPSNGSFFIHSNKVQPLSIKIYSTNGTLVYQNDSIEGLERLQLNLSNGFYVALLISEKSIQQHKLVISK